MAISIATLKAMAAAGISAEKMIAAIEADHAAKADRRKKDAARKRNARARERASEMSARTSADIADATQAVAASPIEPTQDGAKPTKITNGQQQKEKSPLILPSKENNSISLEARALSDDFLVAVGVDPRDPELSGLSGAPYAAAGWVAQGYDRALVLATAADARARHGPGLPLSYYTKCFETAHRKASRASERQIPMLLPVEGNREAAIPTRRDRPAVAPDWQSSRDAWRAARAKLKAHIAESAASEGDGGSVVRLAATARRE